MPIYEYQCQACGHYMDVLQKMSEAPLTDCPDCGEASLRKLVSAPRFRLKGSGWYETDFKSENKRNLADSGDKPEAAEAKPKVEKTEKAGEKTAGAAEKKTKKAEKAPKAGKSKRAAAR